VTSERLVALEVLRMAGTSAARQHKLGWLCLLKDVAKADQDLEGRKHDRQTAVEDSVSGIVYLNVCNNEW
jgi:hypothetical protein